MLLTYRFLYSMHRCRCTHTHKRARTHMHTLLGAHMLRDQDSVPRCMCMAVHKASVEGWEGYFCPQ